MTGCKDGGVVLPWLEDVSGACVREGAASGLGRFCARFVMSKEPLLSLRVYCEAATFSLLSRRVAEKDGVGWLLEGDVPTATGLTAARLASVLVGTAITHCPRR